MVSVYELAQEGTAHYLVLEQVEGETLQARLLRGPILYSRRKNSASFFRERFRFDRMTEYDITPDGQKLVLVNPDENAEEVSAANELIVVTNWFRELDQLASTS